MSKLVVAGSRGFEGCLLFGHPLLHRFVIGVSVFVFTIVILPAIASSATTSGSMTTTPGCLIVSSSV